MSEGPRLLSGLSRAGDALAIITNYVGIQTSEHKRKRQMYEKVRYLIGPHGHAIYDEPLPDLNLVMHDHDLPPDDDEQWKMDSTPETASMHQGTGEGGKGEASGSAWDDGENASMHQATGEGGEGEASGSVWDDGENATWQRGTGEGGNGEASGPKW